MTIFCGKIFQYSLFMLKVMAAGYSLNICSDAVFQNNFVVVQECRKYT